MSRWYIPPDVGNTSLWVQNTVCRGRRRRKKWEGEERNLARWKNNPPPCAVTFHVSMEGAQPSTVSQHTKHLDFIRLQKFRFPHFLSATLAQWVSRQPLAPWPECSGLGLNLTYGPFLCVFALCLLCFRSNFTANLSSKGKKTQHACIKGSGGSELMSSISQNLITNLDLLMERFSFFSSCLMWPMQELWLAAVFLCSASLHVLACSASITWNDREKNAWG